MQSIDTLTKDENVPCTTIKSLIYTLGYSTKKTIALEKSIILFKILLHLISGNLPEFVAVNEYMEIREYSEE